MDNKMSLHIVWPFVILWIIVAAMVGGDLIPLHLVDSTGGVGKVIYMVDELTPVDDLDLSEQFESMEPVDQMNPTDPIADQNPIGDQILQDSIVSDPVDDVTSSEGIPQDALEDITYILNTNSMKFHKLDCHSAELIAPENFKESFDTRDTIIENGYVPCKNCNP